MSRPLELRLPGELVVGDALPAGGRMCVGLPGVDPEAVVRVDFAGADTTLVDGFFADAAVSGFAGLLVEAPVSEVAVDGPGPEVEAAVGDDVDPAEPVVSAKATAEVDAIAAPTPSATASAPTRPT